MFQRKLILDKTSSVEVATRVYDGEERIMITIVGPKSEQEVTASSVILTEAYAALLNQCLTDALNRKGSWPIED
jgi:hypothetical protein